ncbi:hypothetical protein G6F57_012421 [Rhizopus arrhizus]|nr:hypothetical protein G6F57_012421 [Rhizopus arrhizus]
MEAALVVHLLVAADPVAQVDVRQALAAGPFDLLQDREGTQPARGVLRVEEGVDRRQAVLGDVGHRHSQQLAGLAVVAGQAHLHEAGVRPAADQELLELVRAVVVHAAVGVAVHQVAVIQREQVVARGGGGDPHLQVFIAGRATALAAVRGEARDRDAHCHAGLAVRAMRPVDQVTAAAEAPAQRQRVQAAEAAVVRVQHQVARHPVRPVPAGVLAGLEKSQFVVSVAMHRHGHSIAPARRSGGDCPPDEWNRRRRQPMSRPGGVVPRG